MTSSSSSNCAPTTSTNVLGLPLQQNYERQAWRVFFSASFLVSVPVFFQAPIVRLFPWFSLALTLFWIGLGWLLYRRPQSRWWGDIILGFSWSWLAGSIYWGWLRAEPLIHIPVESIGLPFALWFIWRGWGKVGNFFYLGSLLGTAITDLYFYLTNVIPYWRKLMTVDLEPALASPIFKAALAQVQTAWGISWAIVLVNILLAVSLWSLSKTELHWWAFAGAVLSTILVDSLFWIAAYFA
ncbi:DUF3120 domain-containing protein [Pleurocapsa sp. PCC 7319]|uniref:DUF3120 domain-containing protein n=1 Tax=Pleurocapsa sp. PCC 7319 TaxID=118161 RepID=UPI00037FB4E1|nr:DUF3120 domain-containing protein [Pleurocapsa sp. PCC 7319]